MLTQLLLSPGLCQDVSEPNTWPRSPLPARFAPGHVVAATFHPPSHVLSTLHRSTETHTAYSLATIPTCLEWGQGETLPFLPEKKEKKRAWI